MICARNVRNYYRLAVAIGVVSLGLLSHSCGGEDLILGEADFEFRGVVLDSITNSPLDSVAVTTVDTADARFKWFTDSTGYFSGFEFAGADSIALFFRKTGYDTKSISVKSDDSVEVKLREKISPR